MIEKMTGCEEVAMVFTSVVGHSHLKKFPKVCSISFLLVKHQHETFPASSFMKSVIKARELGFLTLSSE